MTTTTAPSTDVRGVSTSTYPPGTRRRISRRTTWVLGGAAAVAITAGGVVVGLQLADADPATGVAASVSSVVGNDAAGPQHGQGPAARAADARDAASIESAQVAHGTAGSLSDAAGRPLLP
jgi:hypothetical protein